MVIKNGRWTFRKIFKIIFYSALNPFRMMVLVTLSMLQGRALVVCIVCRKEKSKEPFKLNFGKSANGEKNYKKFREQ